MRALGDWHATNGRWQQAAERFASLVKVNQHDSSEVTSLDQLRLAAALLEAGDRHSYERWREGVVAKLPPGVGPLPASFLKACLLLPAQPNLLERLSVVSEPDMARSGIAPGRDPTAGHGVAWSDARILLEYRRGNFSTVIQKRFLADNCPRFGTFTLVKAAATWQLKDYWGAMMEWTKGYVLVQAGARQGLVKLSARSDFLPGISEPDYLRAPWYDWAVAGIIIREWDELIGDSDLPSEGEPSLERVARVRAVGEWHALRCEWSDALRCAQYCLQFHQGDSLDHATMDYVNAAIATLELGDENSYVRVREEMASRFKDPDEMTAERMLTVGLLQSLDDRTAGRLEPFAAVLARALANGKEAWSSPFLLGLLDCRRGEYAKAVEWVQKGLPKFSNVAQPSAICRIILAMSLQQLGDRSAAQLELKHAKDLIATGFDLEFDMWHWRSWVVVQLLLREADGLISQTPSPDSPKSP